MNRSLFSRFAIAAVAAIGVVLASGSARLALGAHRMQGDDAASIIKGEGWRPNFHEIGTLRVGIAGFVNNFCVNNDGNLLVCVGGSDPSLSVKSVPNAIRVYKPDGKKVATWKMPIKPGAICVRPDGAIFVGGDGLVFKLDQTGKVVAKGSLPPKDYSHADKQVRDELSQMGREVTGIAATSQDVFVATLAPSDYSYVVYRFGDDLTNPHLIVKSLSGCCGQMDIQTHSGALWVAHNSKHLVQWFDRTGKRLGSFGHFDRKTADAFGGCCEPKNLRFHDGYLYAAESGPPTVLKQFTTQGKFVRVIALPQYTSGCVRMTTDFSKDGSRIFMLDTGAGLIHVMGKI